MANTTNNDAQVMLRMHDIHKSFGDLAVLKGIDVEVRRGEVLAIIGSARLPTANTLTALVAATRQPLSAR